ncbi:hypothetical protein D3C87_777630 [compost metagenome]
MSEEIKAGRDLDALIAEKRGWSDFSKCAMGVYGKAPGIDGRTEVPRFSTSMDAALPLVERFHMSIYAPLRAGEPWVAVAKVQGNGFLRGGRFNGEASTAPLAICKAFLAAVEGGER